MKEQLRLLPAVHTIQTDARFQDMIENGGFSQNGLTVMIQEQLEAVRKQILAGNRLPCETKQEMVDIIFDQLNERLNSSTVHKIRPVINATGVVIHTNLGRSRLSENAIEKMTEVARHYSNLEYNITKGIRGSRHDLVEELICDLTGSEAAMVVNNNAAAVFLVLRSLAAGKNVVVSRGELVEIGGSFRVSSIMEESGAVLKEVGTTNKTHVQDYEHAIDEGTAMLMKVHTSNFKVIGFTASVPAEKLVDIAKQHEDVLTYEDLGSGALYDFRADGIGEEPVVKEVLSSGVDLVTFSGDKLLGGPQCGVIAGKRSLIQKLKKHQLARVLRVDKFTLASLEATLLPYKYDRIAEIPTVRDIIQPVEEIQEQAERFIEGVRTIENMTVNLEESVSMIGGGTMPEVELPTYVVSVKHESLSSKALFAKLRGAETPVIGRIKEEQFILDFRTVTYDEQDQMVKIFNEIFV
ncbi:L-seryl-tRNA(Sec) selenium transferase [Alkalihalobacillus sp. TS-13]|uniref:L-seryl-tRNA(Sec) selenium transferase n=1 Tax=Alkalihalobacillus sp. TS-13 TaxID=2842455 RepID=UPI001C88095D|nr:L-seryl-tRNA(Sec) selenium transferase [Alkalihalobacillus sp. TS-13]